MRCAIASCKAAHSAPRRLRKKRSIAGPTSMRCRHCWGACWSGCPPTSRWDHLLHWSEFVAVSAVMEHNGIPMDMEIANQLLDQDTWAFVRDALVPSINRQYGVYVHDERTGKWSFNTKLFKEYCAREGILWPHHADTGKIDLQDETFDAMATVYPQTRGAVPAASHPKSDACRQARCRQ